MGFTVAFYVCVGMVIFSHVLRSLLFFGPRVFCVFSCLLGFTIFSVLAHFEIYTLARNPVYPSFNQIDR